MTDKPVKADDAGTLVRGSLLSMHLMAAADRYLAEEEVLLIADLLYRLTGEDVSPDKIIEVSREVDEQSTGGAIYWKAAFEPFRALSLEGKETILKSAIMIALSDGDFHDEEKRTLGDLADWLGLSHAEFVSILDHTSQDMGKD